MPNKKASKKAARSAKKTSASTRGAKKPAKKIAKKAARRRPPPEILSLEERAKLLKPRADFLNVLGKVVREWETYRDLRVPGLSVSKLASFGKKAERASEREAEVEEAMQRKLAPLADARRMSHHDAYKALLDTHAAIKLHARVDPGVTERFAFLADLVRNAPAEHDEEPPTT